MRKLMMLCSAISICFFLSCGTSTVKNLTEQPVTMPIYSVAYFADPAVDYVYKAHISLYGKEFGGIFIAKKINDTTHRTVFTTEFGNSIFDFEISPNSYRVNSILEALDKKIIVNTLQKDFTLLLQKDFNISEQYGDEKTLIYKSADDSRYNYLFTSKKDKKLLKLIHASKSKEKIIIEYLSETSTLADRIIIDHKNIKLKIELNRMIN